MTEEAANSALHEYRRLGRELQKALSRTLVRQKPTRTPLPDDIAHLFCPVCEQFIGESGCPDHPRQEILL